MSPTPDQTQKRCPNCNAEECTPINAVGKHKRFECGSATKWDTGELVPSHLCIQRVKIRKLREAIGRCQEVAESGLGAFIRGGRLLEISDIATKALEETK